MHTPWPPSDDPNFCPEPREPYWNRHLETMDPEQRRQEIILPKLRQQLAYAYTHSPFYRRKWDRAGLNPEAVTTFKDFENLPFVTKQDIRDDQAQTPPFGSNLCVHPADIGRIHGTSGTTGRPTAFGVSTGDMQRIAAAHARIMWSFGIRPDDVLFIASFFSLYWGSWGALAGAERLGAAAFPFGAGVPGQTERALHWIREVRPSVFYGTPSYSLYLAELARQQGLDPKTDFNFRILFFSGEPGAGVPATKRRIEEIYGGICVDSGSTGEMAPWMSNCECDQRTGIHLWQDIVYTEIVDPKTFKPVPAGEEGALVYTHLERNSQPMIRFWAGDIARWEDSTCPCGRTYPRLPGGIYGRTDDMLIIRGENVYPSAIEDCIRSFKALGDEYRIVVQRKNTMDELLVQVEHLPECDPNRLPEVQDQLGRAMKTKGLRATVEIMPPNSFERTEFKAKRVIDTRG